MRCRSFRSGIREDIYTEDDGDDSNLNKAHIALFTCATSRGIVLDLVKSTSAKCVINSCMKLISRRGCPRLFLSDNGTGFTSEQTQQFAASKCIDWKFSIAEAPHFGGFWERLVACVKNCLKKTIGGATLRFDELQVILTEVETILNSRPLVSQEDNLVGEPLTPNHLLFGRKLNTNNIDLLSPDETTEIEHVKRLQHLENILNHFWNRWSREYLTALRDYQKYVPRKNTNNIPNVNDIVIIKEDKLPRQQWRLGRIMELIESRDGNIRAAKVLVGKTGNTIERVVNRLYPLEQSFVNFESKIDRPKRTAAILADIKRKLVVY